jgi:two-component system, NarL family, sensor histidine kinase DesK
VPVMTEGTADMRADAQPWVGGWRRLILAAGMLVYPAITATTIHQYSTGLAAALGYVMVAAFCGCYVGAMFSIAHSASVPFWILLGAMTVLFVAELWFAQINAFFLCAVVVSLLVLPLRGWVAPLVVVAALACILVPIVAGWHAGPGWTEAVMVVFTALIWYAFSEVAQTNQTLLEARAEVARLASETERNRIARDLHDLVGHSLTAITVKSNLARQLATMESSPALKEITEVEQLSRQALADVRAAVSGYRDVTLAGELARGRELLRASGIAADIPTATEPPDALSQELFGWAVREGVTNVVRHSRASRCTISVSAAAVEISDDGTATTAAIGNGITGLRERADALGARVEAGPIAPHGWRLRVEVDSTLGAT